MARVIPVVTTTDRSYVLNCYVAIFSIIQASNKEDFYKIHVLVTDLSKEDTELLESLSGENISVTCMEISDVVRNAGLQQVLHFPVQTYYRMFIPLVLPEEKKILYLDSDLCVLRDVAELYGCDLEGHAVGVVRDVPCPHLDGHDRELGDFSCEKTFNSGVLLMDTEAFEREHIREKCLTLLLEDYKREERQLIYADNDALNMVLYEKGKMLEDGWNFQWQYLKDPEIIYEGHRDRYLATAKNPYIVHFAGKIKPWTHPDYPLANVFWDLAQRTKVYGKIVYKNIVDLQRQKSAFDCFENYQFPFSLIPADSRIALYGAGEVGKAFFGQMELLHYAEISLWADRDYEKLQKKGFLVEAPAELLKKEEEYSHVIVAIESKKTADGIINELKKMGIPGEKLVWSTYRKAKK